jgi:hypothetical protein
MRVRVRPVSWAHSARRGISGAAYKFGQLVLLGGLGFFRVAHGLPGNLPHLGKACARHVTTVGERPCCAPPPPSARADVPLFSDANADAAESASEVATTDRRCVPAACAPAAPAGADDDDVPAPAPSRGGSVGGAAVALASDTAGAGAAPLTAAGGGGGDEAMRRAREDIEKGVRVQQKVTVTSPGTVHMCASVQCTRCLSPPHTTHTHTHTHT